MCMKPLYLLHAVTKTVWAYRSYITPLSVYCLLCYLWIVRARSVHEALFLSLTRKFKIAPAAKHLRWACNFCLKSPEPLKSSALKRVCRILLSEVHLSQCWYWIIMPSAERERTRERDTVPLLQWIIILTPLNLKCSVQKWLFESMFDACRSRPGPVIFDPLKANQSRQQNTEIFIAPAVQRNHHI